MIAYLDASSLCKAYVHEEGSQAVAELMESGTRIASSSVGYAEVLATLFRQRRARELDVVTLKEAVRRFRQDWTDVLVIYADEYITPHVDRVVERRALRGFDLVHLASACYLAELTSLEEIVFWTADRELRAAAADFGFRLGPS